MSHDPENAADDAVLVGRARAGDHDAFTILFDRYQRLVRAAVLTVIWDRRFQNTLEDVFDETWLRVFCKLATFDASRSAFSTWLWVIARNAAVDVARQQPRTVVDPFPSGFDPPTNGVDTDPEVFLSLEQCLGTLGEFERSVLMLRYAEGVRVVEVSRRLQISTGQVSIVARRAFDRLRHCLSGKGYDVAADVDARSAGHVAETRKKFYEPS